MAVNNIEHLNDAISLVKSVFNIKEEQMKLFIKGDFFSLSFNFLDITIILATYFSYDWPKKGNYYEIYIEKKGFEAIEFYDMYAYYENKPFNQKFHKNLILEYLTKLKEYTINNMLFFIKFDNKTKKEYLYFNDKIKELAPYNSTESYYYAVFGPQSKKVLDNPIIYK